MAAEFKTSVAGGLNLSKRIYYGKELAPPLPEPEMLKSKERTESYFPAAVTVYAVVYEPEAVDNPDVPSYQPYVHGRCQPPALIPLHMRGVAAEVDCCLDFATVCFSGRWRVHCIKTSRKCDCLVAVPTGDQGSILGVEVDIIGKSYHSQLIIPQEEETKDKGNATKIGNGKYIKGNLFTFQIPQIGGGTTISVKVKWSQKLDYTDGQFCLNVPFTFPSYVNPVSKKISKKEKILLNVNSGTRKEIVRKSNSHHALKEIRIDVGKLGLLYEAQVPNWSTSDFTFSYSVAVNDLFGGVILQSPLLRDFDDRQMFCFYLFPGTNNKKAFRKDVIFLLDISGSMKGDPLANAKSGLISCLSKLDSGDSLNIIAFNSESFLFSPFMEPANEETISRATKWLNESVNASGGTNISAPIKQAMKLLAETTDSMPIILLITDGSVEDERDICNFVKDNLKSGGPISPRIYTLAIGTYCNHYFLQMLAQIGRGYFDIAYDGDSVGNRLQRLFATASSAVIADISVDYLEQLDSVELLPFQFPDLSSGTPLVVSGRYNGKFPDSIKVNGILADMNSFTIELKSRRAKDVQLDQVLAKRRIDSLTSKAWLSGSKELEQQVAKTSLQTGVPSEYTHMILHQTEKGEKALETMPMQDLLNKLNLLQRVQQEGSKTVVIGCLGVGFGDLGATKANVPPGIGEVKSPEAAEMLVKAASNCCGKVADRVCCMCFIQTCSHMNKQCSIVLSQLCAALACFSCIDCCYELCA